MEVRRKLEEEEQRKRDEEERRKREKEEADRQLQVNRLMDRLRGTQSQSVKLAGQTTMSGKGLARLTTYLIFSMNFIYLLLSPI